MCRSSSRKARSYASTRDRSAASSVVDTEVVGAADCAGADKVSTAVVYGTGSVPPKPGGLVDSATGGVSVESAPPPDPLQAARDSAIPISQPRLAIDTS